MIKKAILWALALSQVATAIAWSLGHDWAYGPFVVLVVTSTALHVALAALGGFALLVINIIEGDLDPVEWEYLNLGDLERFVNRGWRRGLFRLLDLSAITSLALAEHPWWALIYLPQVFAEMALVKSARAMLRLEEHAREGEDHKDG